MPIAYAERKKRRQALLQGLSPELRERLALRHVEAVAKLPSEAQQILAEALMAGLRHIQDAITYLLEQPRASVEEVLLACQDGRRASEDGTKSSLIVSKIDLSWSPADPDLGVLAELADLLQDCFPGMPAMTARALAADDLLSDVLALVHAHQACFRSKSIQSELVFVALCGLAQRFINELNRLMDSRSHYRGALEQSGIFAKWLYRRVVS